VAFIRSVLFNVIFYPWLGIAGLGILVTLRFDRRHTVRAVEWFLRTVAFLERTLLGLRYEIRGRENLPTGPVIVAPKHQSAWETMKLHLLLDDPAIVLKQELLKIPLWSRIAYRLDCIVIDRSAGAKALRAMMSSARKILAQGRPVVIFPQGTRVKPGAAAPYLPGVGALYAYAKVPLVPMALNSGLFWPRKSFFKRGGTITVEFLPAIPPGLPADEAIQRLESVLEAASDRLLIPDPSSQSLRPRPSPAAAEPSNSDP
jgi:1-acyl-sn-glycerol-3-phosphate acyltransferase